MCISPTHTLFYIISNILGITLAGRYASGLAIRSASMQPRSFGASSSLVPLSLHHPLRSADAKKKAATNTTPATI